jgi:hypothetical protein
MWQKHVRRFVGHFSKVKEYGRSAYHTGRAVAEMVDSGASVIRRTHEALAPLMHDTDAGRAVSRGIRSGLGDYEHGKSKVLQKHRAVEEATSRVRTALPEYSF